MKSLADTPALVWAADLTLALLLLALVLAAVRLVRGPHVADRLVALDLIAVVSAGLIVLESLRSGSALLLRPALVVGLVGFLGTLAFATALERTGRRARPDRDGTAVDDPDGRGRR